MMVRERDGTFPGASPVVCPQVPITSGTTENACVSFGSELRQERESRGIGLTDIAERTKVSERYLRALEDDDHERLPGGVFNRGLVRGYCQHVGLDETYWLERFTSESPKARQEHDWDVFAENVHRNRQVVGERRFRWLGVLAMLFALAGLGWLAWHYIVRPRTLLGRHADTGIRKSVESRG